MKTRMLIIALFCSLATSAQNWKQITSNTNANLKTIDFPSSSVGYIGGSDSVLLKSIDGGKTWQRLALNNVVFGTSDKTIRHINFVNDTLGYFIVDSPNPSSLMYRTIDGGLTWTNDFNFGLCLPKATFFFDADNGIAVGAGCFSGETIDRLVNGIWQGQQALNSFDPSDELLAIDFLNSNFGMAAGKSDFIFRTTDGGLNWDTIRPAIAEIFVITDILIVDDTLAYATFIHNGTAGGVAITTDGGMNWKSYSDIVTFDYPRFHAIDITGSGDVYFGGVAALGNGIIQRQFDIYWPIDKVDQVINGLATYGDSTVFAVGDSGYIIVNREPLFIGISNAPSITSFECYPNPVENMLSISSSHEIESLQIINVNGQVVKFENVGETIDFSRFSRGIYIIEARFIDKTFVRKKLIKK